MTATIQHAASRQLAAWFARRPSFALMGEYSAGKSALLNALLGQSLLPTRVTATDLPAVWITRGDRLRLQGLTFAGALLDLEIDDLTRDRAMDFLCIRIECDASLLSEVDIIDTPGISDPRMTTVIVEEMLSYVDFVVWCSPINQAWRQTERAFWNRVPQSVKAASILALTRADIMRSQVDVEKVVRRCKADTSGSFAAVMPVSALQADTAMRAAPSTDGKALLQDSGLADLQAVLARSISGAVTRCAERGQRLLLTSPADEAPPAPVRKKAAKTPKRLQTDPEGSVEKIVQDCARLLHDLVPAQATHEDILSQFQRVETALRKTGRLEADHLSVLTLVLKSPADGTIDTTNLVTQVREDLKEFAAGPWCTIGD
jgi:GTPase SAR1 family protein